MLASGTIFAQDEDDDYKRKAASIGFSANLWDYNKSPKFNNLGAGASLYFWKGITNNLDYSVRLNLGITDFYKTTSTTATSF